MPGLGSSSLAAQDPRIQQRLKQELLNTNVTRLLVFSLVFALFQLAQLLANGIFGSEAELASGAGISFSGILGVLNIVAACLGGGFALVFGLMRAGSIRNPHTRSSMVQAALLVLSILQMALCCLEPNIALFSCKLVVYLLMLGSIPLLSRSQSSLYLASFTVLCLIFYFFIMPALLPTLALAGVRFGGSTTGGLSEYVYAAAVAFMLGVVTLTSGAVSWQSYGYVQNSVVGQLQIELREEELEELVEQRCAELKEKAHAAEVANQAKTRFLTRVSHEMRTALTTISGMSFLAREAKDPHSRQESLEAVERATLKLREVVETISDTKKIELDYAEANLDEEFDLLRADAALPKLMNEQVTAPNLAGRNILIVEDLETNRLVLAEFLKDTQATIEEAEDGLQAVEMFAASSEDYYSFVFMDLLMPKMNGHDATRAIRKMERKDAVTVPIVAVSANAFKEDIEASLAAGMDAHLAKPVEQAAIFSVLTQRLT